MAAAAKGISTTKVVTGKVRLSYAHLFEAWTNRPTIPPKFSTVILIPKRDKATIAKLRAAEKAALDIGLQTNKFTEKDIKLGKVGSIIHDGDTEMDLDDNPEYEGHLYMTVSSKTRPGLVGRDLEPILDSTELYSGAYVRVSINAFPYEAQGNKGVSFGLNHVQKLEDGDPLGGRSRAEDDFDRLDDEEDEEDDLL